MKGVLALLVLAMNIQPLAAESCDVETQAHAGHQVQMNDTDHGDCCDTQPGSPAHGCQQVSHCGSCTAAMYIATLKHADISAATLPFSRALAAGQLPPSHASPPFRPPIS